MRVNKALATHSRSLVSTLVGDHKEQINIMQARVFPKLARNRSLRTATSWLCYRPQSGIAFPQPF